MQRWTADDADFCAVLLPVFSVRLQNADTISDREWIDSHARQFGRVVCPWVKLGRDLWDHISFISIYIYIYRMYSLLHNELMT